MFGGVEQVCKQETRKKLEDRQSEEHDDHGDQDAELDGLDDPFPVPGSVIEGDHGDHTVVQPEYRHEYEALQFKIYAEYRRRGRREHQKDSVHAKGHDRTNGLHDNRRNANLVDNGNCPWMGTESLQADADLCVLPDIEIKRHQYRHNLSDDGRKCGACDFQAGKSEKAEDQYRIQNYIDDGAGSLCDHIIDGLSGRLHQSLKCNLQKDTGGAYGDDGQVLCAVCNDGLVVSLHGKKQV